VNNATIRVVVNTARRLRTTCTYHIRTRVIRRIHGAIVAATGRSDHRGDCRRDDRLVYTLQAIVAVTIASTVAATIAPCIVYTPYNSVMKIWQTQARQRCNSVGYRHKRTSQGAAPWVGQIHYCQTLFFGQKPAASNEKVFIEHKNRTHSVQLNVASLSGPIHTCSVTCSLLLFLTLGKLWLTTRHNVSRTCLHSVVFLWTSRQKYILRQVAEYSMAMEVKTIMDNRWII